MHLEAIRRTQTYRTSLRSDCFIYLPYCPSSGALQFRRTPDARERGKRGRAGLALVTPNGFMEIQRQADDDERPVGRSVSRLGPYRPIARRGHYSLRSGGICVELRQLKTAVGLGAPSIPRHCCSSVTDPGSTLDNRTGSNPVRGPCEGLGVFVLVSLSTRRRAAILSVTYLCGQARGKLNMKF